jgi:2-keto-4-pentenoate hydratase/2-oxohepta-3-ene-1,7-dioic acid hydratase in catechol pathway
MRFVSFQAAGKNRFGIALDQGIVDLSEKSTGFTSLKEALAASALPRLAAMAAGAATDFAFADAEFQIPIPDPAKIVCVGVNYANRSEEYERRVKESEYPNLFLRTTQSFVGHRVPLVVPKVSSQLDYEGEIVLVIGKSGRYIDRADAMKHVAGITIGNEGTVRDWTKHGARNSAGGKNFDASGSIGPWMEDGFGVDGDPLAIRTWVNDELRQNDTTKNIIYPFDLIISYVSRFTRLVPGDLIFTGTPTGAGVRFNPPRFLAPGDRLRIDVSGVGTLENQIVAEQ